MAGLLVLLLSGQVQAAEKKFIFFDPDANQFDVVALSGVFTKFLQGINNDYTFQVVQDPAVFQTELKNPAVAFVMVTSESLDSLGSVPLKPLLVPATQGDAYYRKILLDTGKSDPSKMTGKSVAVTAARTAKNIERLTDDLAAMNIHGVRFVSVPKDIDALLALFFGQVDAALVTPVSIEVLKQVNPRAAASYRALGETKKILRSPVCVLKGRVSEQEEDALVTALRHMSDRPEGRELMRRLSFDGWEKFYGGMAKR